jgi:hypothetical protein
VASALEVSAHRVVAMKVVKEVVCFILTSQWTNLRTVETYPMGFKFQIFFPISWEIAADNPRELKEILFVVLSVFIWTT